jgi:hypothetical protein
LQHLVLAQVLDVALLASSCSCLSPELQRMSPKPARAPNGLILSVLSAEWMYYGEYAIIGVMQIACTPLILYSKWRVWNPKISVGGEFNQSLREYQHAVRECQMRQYQPRRDPPAHDVMQTSTPVIDTMLLLLTDQPWRDAHVLQSIIHRWQGYLSVFTLKPGSGR